MENIVLDTNCLVSSLKRSSIYFPIWRDFILGKYCLCFTDDILHESEKDKWQQAPSATDIKNSNSMIRRVWGMGSKTIYLFNKDGVKATIPFSVYGR